MLLSIIIPHYNLPEELLKRCIKSILTQDSTGIDYEIIIVDDGSTTPPEWVTDYSPIKITLIKSNHEGLGAARNKGLDHATGEYIMFIDSDDYLAPDSFKQCFPIINEEHPEIFRFKFGKNPGDAMDKKPKFSKTISGASFMATNNLPGSACLYIFSRKLVERLNLRFKCGIYHEDEEFTTKLHYHALTLIDSNIPAYIYDTRPGSITQSKDQHVIEKRISDYLAVLSDVKKFNDENQATASPMQRKGINRKQAHLTIDVIINLFRLGIKAGKVHHICDNILRKSGLYPLPKEKYSIKYRCFRLLANSKMGLHILKAILPKR